MAAPLPLTSSVCVRVALLSEIVDSESQEDFPIFRVNPTGRPRNQGEGTGTPFTAYTFTAVPGLAYGSGAPAFFAVPYTVIVCPLAFVLLSRLWAVARRHGYVTAADFVRGRYGSPPLALVVALTGILATMLYPVLQLLGIRAVLTAGGVYPRGAVGDGCSLAEYQSIDE